jgi:hypothetical protein
MHEFLDAHRVAETGLEFRTMVLANDGMCFHPKGKSIPIWPVFMPVVGATRVSELACCVAVVGVSRDTWIGAILLLAVVWSGGHLQKECI